MSLRTPDARAIETGEDGGCYRLPSCEPGWVLFFIVSNGLGWEHVSVRAVRRGAKRAVESRVPTWKEMRQVKAACWDEEDAVVQFHPAARDYVNVHPAVLHLWRPLDQVMPMPPVVCV